MHKLFSWFGLQTKWLFSRWNKRCPYMVYRGSTFKNTFRQCLKSAYPNIGFPQNELTRGLNLVISFLTRRTTNYSMRRTSISHHNNTLSSDGFSTYSFHQKSLPVNGLYILCNNSITSIWTCPFPYSVCHSVNQTFTSTLFSLFFLVFVMFSENVSQSQWQKLHLVLNLHEIFFSIAQYFSCSFTYQFIFADPICNHQKQENYEK